MYWAIRTALCSALRSEAEQLPYLEVMQSVRMLSMMQLNNFLSLWGPMPDLFSLLGGNRHCCALFTTVLVRLDHDSLLMMWTPRNLISQLSKSSQVSSCFHWSSLRCFYNLIGVHLLYIQLIGHNLERHTPFYIRSHSWQWMSEQKPSHEVELIDHRATRQDCVDAQIWGRETKHFCSIEGSQGHSGLHHSSMEEV